LELSLARVFRTFFLVFSKDFEASETKRQSLQQEAFAAKIERVPKQNKQNKQVLHVGLTERNR